MSHKIHLANIILVVITMSYSNSQSTVNTTSSTLLAQVRQIILSQLKAYSVQVYLVGSHARGTARPTSDIDVGISPKEPLPTGVLAQVREALFESTLPVNVDLIDLSQTDEQFRQQILPEAIVWKD